MHWHLGTALTISPALPRGLGQEKLASAGASQKARPGEWLKKLRICTQRREDLEEDSIYPEMVVEHLLCFRYSSQMRQRARQTDGLPLWACILDIKLKIEPDNPINKKQNQTI